MTAPISNIYRCGCHGELECPRRAWFRRARGLPPELTFILALGALASLLYLAVA